MKSVFGCESRAQCYCASRRLTPSPAFAAAHTPAGLFDAALCAVFVAISAGLVVWVAPASAGSGIPDMKGYLNGTNLKQALTCNAGLAIAHAEVGGRSSLALITSANDVVVVEGLCVFVTEDFVC